MIVLAVDIPGGIGCVHRVKKQVEPGVVSRALRQREDE